MAPQGSLLPLATHLQSTKPPWTTLLVLQGEQRLESAVKIPEAFVRRIIRGSKCRSAAGLFAEMAHALAFPDYFGHNWDALEECLADLEWLPAKGYVLCFTNAESILPDDDEDFATLLEVISDAGETWASGRAGQRPSPFHAVLAVSEPEKSKLMHRGVPLSASLVGRSGTTRRRSR
jgi:RNAse (barnase) inhibitor barstar